MLVWLQSTLYGMGLEKPEFDEFLQHKKKIVKIGKQLPSHTSNKLLEKYAELTDNEADVLVKLCEPNFQDKIKELHDFVANESSYKETLQKAIYKKTEDDWFVVRQVTRKLSHTFLATKGFVITDQEKQELEANKDISSETAEYAVASLFLKYYMRGLQRNITGKALPAIPIKQ